MNRRYEIVGYGGTRGYEADLCEYHANIKRKFSLSMKEIEQSTADAKCQDCRTVPGPLVIDRLISEADKEVRTESPAPVKVLPGQRRLFE